MRTIKAAFLDTLVARQQGKFRWSGDKTGGAVRLSV